MKFDYDYMDALGLTYQVQDAYAYDDKSISTFEFATTLEIIDYLRYITPKDEIQNIFATLLTNALEA